MERRTPERNLDTSNNQTLTPVRYLDSPKSSPRITDTNLAHIRARLDVIQATLKDNYQKWCLAHTRGQSLCNSIEAIKTRCLSEDASKSKDGTSLYPKELKAYCDKLAIITSIFVDITRNASESLKQLRSMLKLAGCSGDVLYRSWTIREFVQFVETLVYCYERETKVKQHVMVELAHCTVREDLIRCATAWEYPQHVDGRVKLMFAFLVEETSTNTMK